MIQMEKNKFEGLDLSKISSLSALLAELMRRNATQVERFDLVKIYLDGRARESGTPLTGVFELTPLCNLDCKMCYVHLQKGQMSGKDLLPVEAWVDIIDQACDAGMMYARVTGGECLTYPGFKNIYLHLKSRGIETKVLTNGVLLNDDMIELFTAHRPESISITLYGSNDDVYERVTGSRMFSTVLENIKKVKAAKIPLKLSITPNRFMGQDAKCAITLCRELGLPYVVNAGLFEARDETGREISSYGITLDEQIDISLFDAKARGVTVHPCGEEMLPPQRTGEKGGKGVRCGAGKSNFTITWEGVMQPCGMFDHVQAYPRRDGFIAAWREINKAANAYPLPAECDGCAYEPVCKHCVMEHRQGAEIGHANPDTCAWGRRMVMEGLVSLPGQ